jgi:ribosomal protein L30E
MLSSIEEGMCCYLTFERFDIQQAVLRKRYVLGLREVARSVKLAEVKIVVIAPNIDENSSEGLRAAY